MAPVVFPCRALKRAIWCRCGRQVPHLSCSTSSHSSDKNKVGQRCRLHNPSFLMDTHQTFRAVPPGPRIRVRTQASRHWAEMRAHVICQTCGELLWPEPRLRGTHLCSEEFLFMWWCWCSLPCSWGLGLHVSDLPDEHTLSAPDCNIWCGSLLRAQLDHQLTAFVPVTWPQDSTPPGQGPPRTKSRNKSAHPCSMHLLLH